MSSNFTPSERTRVSRLPERGAYDREAVHAILDDGFVCHIGFAIEGQPYVIPTMYARAGDALYIHGSAASRMLRHLSSGAAICVTVTHADGLVLARSVFNHSMNYRSVVALGKATLVADPGEKLEAMRLFTERILPGRWAEARQPNAQEMKATSILRVEIAEASAKVRDGGPHDDEADMALPVWAGVIPMRMQFGAPERDATCKPEIPLPEYLAKYGK